MTCGIYMIQNTINGKIYIGQSIDIELRFKSHKNKLERGNHDNIHLQKSWRKYGKEKFEFDILCECEEEKLNETEEYYIFELMTYNDKVGYNKQYGGQSNRPTKETKEKLSKSHKGKNIGENNNMFGKHHSDESKKKMDKYQKFLLSKYGESFYKIFYRACPVEQEEQGSSIQYLFCDENTNSIRPAQYKIATADCAKSIQGRPQGGGCAATIIKDGWTIQNDYPW